MEENFSQGIILIKENKIDHNYCRGNSYTQYVASYFICEYTIVYFLYFLFANKIDIKKH